jgi:hypothetical protein
VPNGKDITNSIMVIDMQNDFTLPHPRGAFSVTDGVKIIRPLVSWLDNGVVVSFNFLNSRELLLLLLLLLLLSTHNGKINIICVII